MVGIWSGSSQVFYLYTAIAVVGAVDVSLSTRAMLKPVVRVGWA